MPGEKGTVGVEAREIGGEMGVEESSQSKNMYENVIRKLAILYAN